MIRYVAERRYAPQSDLAAALSPGSTLHDTYELPDSFSWVHAGYTRPGPGVAGWGLPVVTADLHPWHSRFASRGVHHTGSMDSGGFNGPLTRLGLAIGKIWDCWLAGLAGPAGLTFVLCLCGVPRLGGCAAVGEIWHGWHAGLARGAGAGLRGLRAFRFVLELCAGCQGWGAAFPLACPELRVRGLLRS